MAYEIKPVDASRLDEVFDIWSLTFGYYEHEPEESEPSRERLRQYMSDHVSYMCGAYCDGRLVATTAVIDFQLQLGSAHVPCAGVAGVAVRPEHRRRGLVPRMLGDAIGRARGMGVPVSALHPFSYPFYRRLGYEVCDTSFAVKVELKCLRKLGNADNFSALALDGFASLMPVHQRWADSHNLSMKRERHRWLRLLDPPHAAARLFAHRDGYMLWYMGEGGDCLNVREWCWLSDECFLDGLELLGQMESQFRSARFSCAEIESLLRLGVFDPVPEIRLNPGVMMRVVDAGAFLEALGLDRSACAFADPLAVTGPIAGEGAVGVGAAVQLATGFFRRCPEGIGRLLFERAAGKPSSCAEKF